jgi:hypothetical protein
MSDLIQVQVYLGHYDMLNLGKETIINVFECNIHLGFDASLILNNNSLIKLEKPIQFS